MLEVTEIGQEERLKTLIPIDKILYINEDVAGSLFYLDGGYSILVVESLETIKRLIEQHYE